MCKMCGSLYMQHDKYVLCNLHVTYMLHVSMNAYMNTC